MKLESLSGFWSSVVSLSIGFLVAQVYAILTVPIIARIYTPDSYGVLGVFNAVSGVVSVIAALRYEKAIILAKNHEVSSLLRLSAALVFLMSLTLFFTLYITEDRILKLLGVINYPGFIHYLPLSILLQGILLLILSLGQREKIYRIIAVSIAIQSITSNSSKIVLGYFFTPQAFFLIQSELIGIAAAILYLLIKLGINHFNGVLTANNLATPYIVAKQYRKFFRYDVLNSFFSTSSWLLPILIINFLFSATEAGYYVLAFSILRIPINLIGKSAEDVFYQQSSSFEDTYQLGKNTSAVMWSLIRISFLPMLVVAFFGDILFTFVFGEGWESAGQIARILAPLVFFWLLSLPVTTLFNTLQKQEKLMIFVTVGTGLRIIALIIGGIYKNLYLSIILFSFFSILIYLLQLRAAFNLTSNKVMLIFKSELFKSRILLIVSVCGSLFLLFPLSPLLKASIIILAFAAFELKLLLVELKAIKRGLL